MMDVIVERLLSNIMKVKTSMEQDFNRVDNQGTEEEQEESLEQGTGEKNGVQTDTEVNYDLKGTEGSPTSTGTGIVSSTKGTKLNLTGIASNSYILLEGHKGIVFKDRDKIRIKRLGWLYGKRFRNM